MSLRARVAFGVLVLAGAGPQCAFSARCQLQPLQTMAVQIEDSRVSVGGSVNRRATRLMLDTGSSDSYVDQALSIELALPRKSAHMYAVGASGLQSVEAAHVEEISVGGMSGSKMDVAVLEDAGGREGFGMQVGADFLMQTDVEFNLPGRQVSFYRTSDCEHGDLAYWDAAAEVVHTRSAGSRDRRQIFDVLVNGHKVRAIIDSGAPGTALDLETATRLGLSSTSAGARTPLAAESAGQIQFTVPIDALQIGDEIIQRQRVAVVDLEHGNKHEAALMNPEFGEFHEDIELLLGLDFLLRHRVMFAVKEQKIFFSYVKPAATP